MRHYRVICRGELPPEAIIELSRRGVYRALGGPTPVDSAREHHHLRIEAENESQAINQAHRAIEDSSGDTSGIAEVVVVGSD